MDLVDFVGSATALIVRVKYSKLSIGKIQVSTEVYYCEICFLDKYKTYFTDL